jgi:hypothetical protein
MISTPQQPPSKSTIKTPKIPKLAWKRQWRLQQIASKQLSQIQPTSARSAAFVTEQTSNIFCESTFSYPQCNNLPQSGITSIGSRQSSNSCLQILSSTCSITPKQINPSSTLLTRKRKLDELVSSNQTDNVERTLSLPNFKIRKLENGKLTQHPKVKNALSYVF